MRGIDHGGSANTVNQDGCPLASNIGGIVGLVTSYWDDTNSESRESSAATTYSIFSDFEHKHDRVGYLDPAKRLVQSADSTVVSQRPLIDTHETAFMGIQQERELADSNLLPLPNDVRMITHSDSIPRPDLPAPPPPALPNLSESPLASLIAAASRVEVDFDWLESFDNATLESIVPRDPVTRRPLTIGSIEHESGNCRPCIFFLKAKCFKGLRCTFCHANHTNLRKSVPRSNSIQGTSNGTAKSKRLRPSKRTREMIKQINEQMLFEDIKEDPSGPPLSAGQQLVSFLPPTVEPYL